MALKALSYPSGGFANNTIFVDDRWATSVPSVIDQAPVLSAFSRPLDYCRDYDDFTDLNPTTAETYTVTTSAVVGLSSTIPGGVVSVSTAGAANVEQGIQRLTVWNLNSTKTIYHAIRFNKAASATVGGFVLGLTTVGADPAATATIDGLYFLKADGSASIAAVSRASSTATTTSAVATLVAATNMELGIVATSTSALFYVNGVLVATHTTNLPATTADLRVNLVPRAAAAGTATALLFDYHDTYQARTV